MHTIKIGFADFWPEWSEEDFITPIVSKHFNIIIDNKNPDILFHSVFGQSANNYKCKKILFLGENQRYSKFNTNFSISFDPHTDTNFRLPLWQAYILKKPELLDRLFNKVKHDSFNEFCSFTVSNSGNVIRNGMFQQLNNYKKVKSYGRYLTNDQSLQNLSKGQYWRDAKEHFFVTNKHKFCLTYENNMYPYYCTEKIMDAFLGGSIPIYWGDPKVGQDWNKAAYIDAMRTPDIMVEIKRLDTDKSAFEEKYNEPVFTDVQKQKLIDNLKSFEIWLIQVINQ